MRIRDIDEIKTGLDLTGAEWLGGDQDGADPSFRVTVLEVMRFIGFIPLEDVTSLQGANALEDVATADVLRPGTVVLLTNASLEDPAARFWVLDDSTAATSLVDGAGRLRAGDYATTNHRVWRSLL